ncbi:ABC transporter substrate-binding protein [Roseomonas sp. AR75]|jgi:branched-chain amino acid transport system substrate-binding protein|uniref:ABC transporter substrate-binding protein n=1 Tax=Roseomonas sp. AR75 TaxID=2562311 RepID=UPI0014858AB6|nr:ABC transporter substrate-binding protein [Roseomonas sp. AR75]
MHERVRSMARRALFGRRALALAAAASLAGPARPALAQQPAQPAAELRLGALFPLSGPLALLGDESFRGVELAVEERNAAGGVLGRPARLVRADVPDEATAVAEARKLTAGADRVAAIFGSYAAAIALPASQVAEAAGVPWFELNAISDAVMDRGFRWVFRASPSAADFAAAGIAAVTEVLSPALQLAPDALRLAIAQQDAQGAQSVADAQEALAKVRGLTLVERATYAARAADLNALVQRLRGLEADVVLHTGAPGDEVLLFRALREANWQPRMVIGTAGGYGLTETARSIGDAFLGAMSADWTPFAVNERFAPGARAFAEAYLRRYGAEPRSGISLACFVGARLFLEALQRGGGVEKEKVRAGVLALDLAEATTATGWGARFDERGQNLRAKPVLCQWQAEQQLMRQVAIEPAAAAVASVVPRLGR